MACAASALAQPEVIEPNDYRYLNRSADSFYSAKPSYLFGFFRKMEYLLRYGERQITILHIGDSHIQADFFSGQVRALLNNQLRGSSAGRGLCFPYALAKTNGPSDYRTSATGAWQTYRNVQAEIPGPLGIEGIAARTWSAQASITVMPRVVFPQGLHNRIKVLYTDSTHAYQISLGNTPQSNIASTRYGKGFVEFTLLYALPEVTVEFERKSVESDVPFTLLGISLENQDAGIIYHSMGVNGATVMSFLKCDRLQKDLMAIMPDLIVISLGTNDAYGYNFDSLYFQANMLELMRRLTTQRPETPIILTSPGDNQYRGRSNPHNAEAARAMKRLADADHCALWDFYAAMGGGGSIKNWLADGLCARDYVHLSRAGYALQGQMMFSAYLHGFDKYAGEGRP